METADVVVVGGGIVGLATALEVQARRVGRVVVLEKEAQPAQHQTGRNSGVIHAGVYYAPGSLKARFCREGAAATRAFCTGHGIPFQDCGKLIVATDAAELPRMAALLARAQANGIRIEPVPPEEARVWEPNIRVAGALWSPDTGIVDYGDVARAMAALFVARGGELRCGVRVTAAREAGGGVGLATSAGQVSAGRVVVCAGLLADRMAAGFGLDPPFRIVPFRGEYFAIRNQPPDLVQRLIYPVPDPERPFLGVHLTRKIGGGFTIGPNAVLALAREGYGWRDVSARDLADTALWPGFWRMLRRNLGPAMSEMAGSLSRRAYLARVRRYCPRVGLGDLAPYRSGVRAQAVARDGRLIDDFLFMEGRHSLHVCNAPSPAATAALPIAAHVADRLLALR